MKLERKRFDAAEFKATDPAQGIAEMIVSVFQNVDSGQEVVQPGFFAKSLATRRTADGRPKAKGVWSHDWKSPVAKTLDARELAPGDPLLPPSLQSLGGLWVKGQFNLDTQRGREAFSDLQFGAIDEFSIGYEVLKDSFDAAKGVRYLEEGELFEWSPVLVGMNDSTALLSVKAAEATKTVEQKDAPAGSYEALAQEVADAYAVQRGGTVSAYPVATFADHVVVCVWPNSGMTMDNGPTYWSVPYSRDADGALVLGAATQVEEQTAYVPAKERALRELARKAAIRSHSTDTTDAGWDSGMMWRRCPADAAALKAACAWMDPNGDPATKSTYKFIHHMVDADGKVGAANLTACSTGIGVLNGGRGGTAIPDADVAGVHAHLAKHLTDAGNDAPPLKAVEPEGVKEGRRNAASDQTRIQQLHDLASELGAACGAADEPAKSDAPTVAKDEEPGEAKSKEPRGLTTLAALIAIELLELGTG